MRRGTLTRIVFVIALVWAAIGTVIAVRLATAPSLPDVTALEARLDDAVADRVPLGDIVAALESEGFDCVPGMHDSNELGSRYCEIVERESENELDCPMRVTVTLLFDDTARLVRYAVTRGAFCM